MVEIANLNKPPQILSTYSDELGVKSALHVAVITVILVTFVALTIGGVLTASF